MPQIYKQTEPLDFTKPIVHWQGLNFEYMGERKVFLGKSTGKHSHLFMIGTQHKSGPKPLLVDKYGKSPKNYQIFTPRDKPEAKAEAPAPKKHVAASEIKKHKQSEKTEVSALEALTAEIERLREDLEIAKDVMKEESKALRKLLYGHMEDLTGISKTVADTLTDILTTPRSSGREPASEPELKHSYEQ